MQALNISKRKFSELKKYELPNEVYNTECQLFVIENKSRWVKRRLLLKKLYIDQGEYFGNKLLTINTLIDNKDVINIEELVFPEAIVVVDRQVVGFSMPLIENSVNLTTLLQDYNIPIQERLKYLKQVGEILKSVQRAKQFENKFFLGDVYESNFIYNKDNGEVYAVDLDSCKIGNNRPFPARYLATNKNILILPNKYPINEQGIHIPNMNTELMCYVLMILNTIANGPIYRMTIDKYYLYLEYLRNLGFSNEILDCFSKIYIKGDNVSPLELLEQIPNNIFMANHNVFDYKMKRKGY